MANTTNNLKALFPLSNRYWLAFICFLTIPLSGLSIDVYVPSLPDISQYFDASRAAAQLTVTTYMLGLGLFQFFIGGISDSIGRKKPAMFWLLFFTISTLIVPLAQDITQLLILRFLQGIAVAGMSIPLRAVISDLFEGREFYKMVNYMTICWAIGPIIAPAIGGYLQYYFNWHAPFYFLAIYGFMMLVLNLLFVPETAKHYHSVAIKEMMQRYRQVIFHWQYALGLLCLGLLYSLLILFSITGSFFIQKVLHYSVITFGHIALLMGVAWLLGNITNRLLIEIKPEKKLKVAFWALLATSTTLLILTLRFPDSLTIIILFTFIILYCGSIGFPNFYAKSIALFPQLAAIANALLGAFLSLIAGITSGLGTLLKSNSAVPLSGAYVFIALICVSSLYLSNCGSGKNSNCQPTPAEK